MTARRELRFVVEGTPVPYARARRNGRTGHYFTDPKSQAYRDHVALMAVRARGGRWASGHRCKRAVPGALRRGKRMTCACAWCAPEYRLELLIVKPDRRTRDEDNIEKNVLDALTGVLWHDDRQALVEKKDRQIDPERPRIEVTVRRV